LRSGFKCVLYFPQVSADDDFLFAGLFTRSAFYFNYCLLHVTFLEYHWISSWYRERLFEEFWISVFKKPLELDLKLTEAEVAVKIFLAAVYI